MDSKYIVFKREDWEQLQEESPECDSEQFILEDAVVIRLQDIFAESALFAYAAAIRTSIEILEETLKDANRPDTDPMIERLTGIADYFMRQGEAASKHSHRKVPD